jgi:hypothetical protein
VDPRGIFGLAREWRIASVGLLMSTFPPAGVAAASDSPEAPWRSGLRGARANLVPGLVLQLSALALVVTYYRHAPTHDLLTRLAVWRDHAGVGVAIGSTAFFGGLLPFLYLRSRPATRFRYNGKQGAAIIAFWAYKGFEVDLFYRLLARWVGPGHELTTLLTKMFLDQFVYCPFFAVPVTVLVYEWVEEHFHCAPMRADLRAGAWYRRHALPVLISNLGVWLPAVAIIYSLPTPLQLPLQNLVLCFFTLLVAHQIRRS